LEKLKTNQESLPSQVKWEKANELTGTAKRGNRTKKTQARGRVPNH